MQKVRKSKITGKWECDCEDFRKTGTCQHINSILGIAPPPPPEPEYDEDEFEDDEEEYDDEDEE